MLIDIYQKIEDNDILLQLFTSETVIDNDDIFCTGQK